MNKPFPALCMHCKYSKPTPRSEWSNRCFNPEVVASDSWALANNDEGKPCGRTCLEERKRVSWFAPCGAKGKLWEPKGWDSV